MNDNQCAALVASNFNSIEGLKFYAAAVEDTAEKPYGVVRFENFTENPTLLGNYDGEIIINVRTNPEDTTAAAVTAWSDEIVSRLADANSLDTAFDGKYTAAECWNVISQTSAISDGIRETTVSVSVSLVQLS